MRTVLTVSRQWTVFAKFSTNECAMLDDVTEIISFPHAMPTIHSDKAVSVKQLCLQKMCKANYQMLQSHQALINVQDHSTRTAHSAIEDDDFQQESQQHTYTCKIQCLT